MYQKDDSFERLIKRAIDFYDYSKQPSEYCPIFPDHILIEPTNLCNLKCIHCHQSKRGTYFTKRRGSMDFEVFKKVIDEIKHLSSRITLNQQGEPLLHKKILEMVEYAKDSGLSVSLLTNATKLTQNIADKLIHKKLDRIVFSFDGSNKSIYEKIRIGGNYEETLLNILYFLKKNYENGMKTFVCMSVIDSSYSHDDIDNYKKYFNSLPISTIFISQLLNMSGASSISKEIDMNKYRGIKKEDLPLCRMPWEMLAVNWDGTISPCGLDYNESHIIGNIHEDSLINIFNSKEMKNFRRCHLENNFDLIEEKGPLCASCNGRFFPEYDMKKTKKYTIKNIVRQSHIFSNQKRKSKRNKQDNEEKRYVNLLNEIKNMKQIK